METSLYGFQKTSLSLITVHQMPTVRTLKVALIVYALPVIAVMVFHVSISMNVPMVYITVDLMQLAATLLVASSVPVILVI